MVTLDSQFMLWGSVYVLLKWTVGIWAFRLAKASLARHREAGLASRYPVLG
jgi:hypothetical protein